MSWRDRLREALTAEPSFAGSGESAKSFNNEAIGTTGAIGIGVFSANWVRPPPPIAPALVPWHDGVARLQTMPPPLGFAATRWRRVCLDATALLDRHGPELLALGWTDADAFGLHPDAPGAAVDSYGLALLLDGGTVEELTAQGACIARPDGATLRMRRGCRRAALPAWELDE